jgi:hypothetical protein
MFFIGGFNTILPYLIYLSLIWVFLIAGSLGRLPDWKYLRSDAQSHTGIVSRGHEFNLTAHSGLDTSKEHQPDQALSENRPAGLLLNFPIVSYRVSIVSPFIHNIFFAPCTFRGPPTFPV